MGLLNLYTVEVQALIASNASIISIKNVRLETYTPSKYIILTSVKYLLSPIYPSYMSFSTLITAHSSAEKRVSGNVRSINPSISKMCHGLKATQNRGSDIVQEISFASGECGFASRAAAHLVGKAAGSTGDRVRLNVGGHVR
jgi:hypothetical protein